MVFNYFLVATLCSLMLGAELSESSSVIYAPAFIVTPLNDVANWDGAAGSDSSAQGTRPISLDSHSANAHTSEQRVTISEYTGTSITKPSTNPSSLQGTESDYQKSGSNPAYDWFGFWGASRSGDPKPNQDPKYKTPKEGVNSKGKTSIQSTQSTQSTSAQSGSVTSSTSNQPSKPSSSKLGKSEDNSKTSSSSLPSILYTPAN